MSGTIGASRVKIIYEQVLKKFPPGQKTQTARGLFAAWFWADRPMKLGRRFL